MKKILPIVLIAFSLTTSAQKIRFTDSRNHWITTGLGGMDPTIYFRHYFSYGADTVMYFQTYKQLKGQSSNIYMIREDTVANIVYYRIPSDDSMEHVLYDYNLHIGDSIKYVITQLLSSIVDTVVNIDSITINGVYHKVFTMQSKNTVNPYYGGRAYTLIEGVGCTDNPIWPPFFLGCFEYEEKLLCFGQDTIQPAITTAYGLCTIQSYDSFRNCNPLSVNILQKPINTLTIFPNPVSTELNISYSDKIVNINITNLIGQTVYSHEYNSTQVQINVADLPKGIYFIKINGSEVRKFVKE